MVDIERFFLWFVSFFGILSVMGIFLGYGHLIYFPISFFAIVFAGYAAWRIVRNLKTKKIIFWKHICGIALFLLAIDLYVSLPYLVYPHSYVDFGMNVAQARLVTNDGGFPSFSHVYPNVYYGVFALFNSLFFHSYTLSSMIAIILQIMTVFAVFFIGKEAFDEKTGLVAAFVYGFSFVNILLLEQGYLTQNYGQFFFAVSIYLLIKGIKDSSYRPLLVLSLAGLVSYPHYFAIMFLYMLLYQRKFMKYVFLSIALMSVELVGMAFHYIANRTTVVNSFVMHGGIIVPNALILATYLIGFVGLFVFVRRGSRHDSASSVGKMIFLIVGVMSLFVLIFLVNYYVYTWRTPDMRQLYTVVKILYLLFVPVSVFSGFVLKRSVKYSTAILVLFALFYSFFFVNYMLLIDGKNNLPNGVYYSSEDLIEFNRNSSLGFDYGILQTEWAEPKMYDTLYGAEDNYTIFSMAEMRYLLQGGWGWDDNKKTYRSSINIDVNYTRFGVDLYLTLDNPGNCDDFRGLYLCSVI